MATTPATPSKAIEQSRRGFTIGHAALGLFRNQQGTVEREVHDGDTVTVRALGNFGVRFLGVDAPERSFPLPGTTTPFVDIADPQWTKALTDPFASDYRPFKPKLDPALEQHLRDASGPSTAPDHARLGRDALDALTRLVRADMQELGEDEESFRFFLAFAYQVVDGYGRMLCYLHPDQPRGDPRKDSYNERLLQAGLVTPYFIWPNVDPFHRIASIEHAVVPPGRARELADATPKLRRAREWTRAARA